MIASVVAAVASLLLVSERGEGAADQPAADGLAPSSAAGYERFASASGFCTLIGLPFAYATT